MRQALRNWYAQIWRATCKLPLQTVLCVFGLANGRAGFGSLKLGELCEAAQITDDILVVAA